MTQVSCLRTKKGCILTNGTMATPWVNEEINFAQQRLRLLCIIESLEAQSRSVSFISNRNTLLSSGWAIAKVPCQVLLHPSRGAGSKFDISGIANLFKAAIDGTKSKSWWRIIRDAVGSFGLKRGDKQKSFLSGAKDHSSSEGYRHLSDRSSQRQHGFHKAEKKSVVCKIQPQTQDTCQIESADLVHIDCTEVIHMKCTIHRPFTGQWISKHFEETMTSTGTRVLFITGSPGMGKSAVSASIYGKYPTKEFVDEEEDTFKSKGRFLGECHLFPHMNPLYSNPRNRQQSIAWQLCSSVRCYPKALEIKLKALQGEQISHIKCKELFDVLFEQLLRQVGIDHNVIIVIGGIDQFSSQVQREIEDILESALPDLPSRIQVVITTRPFPICRMDYTDAARKKAEELHFVPQQHILEILNLTKLAELEAMVNLPEDNFLDSDLYNPGQNLSLSKDLAMCISYLHDKERKDIHRSDLKVGNILQITGPTFCLKKCDFGFSNPQSTTGLTALETKTYTRCLIELEEFSSGNYCHDLKECGSYLFLPHFIPSREEHRFKTAICFKSNKAVIDEETQTNMFDELDEKHFSLIPTTEIIFKGGIVDESEISINRYPLQVDISNPRKLKVLPDESDMVESAINIETIKIKKLSEKVNQSKLSTVISPDICIDTCKDEEPRSSDQKEKEEPIYSNTLSVLGTREKPSHILRSLSADSDSEVSKCHGAVNQSPTEPQSLPELGLSGIFAFNSQELIHSNGEMVDSTEYQVDINQKRAANVCTKEITNVYKSKSRQEETDELRFHDANSRESSVHQPCTLSPNKESIPSNGEIVDRTKNQVDISQLKRDPNVRTKEITNVNHLKSKEEEIDELRFYDGTSREFSINQPSTLSPNKKAYGLASESLDQAKNNAKPPVHIIAPERSGETSFAPDEKPACLANEGVDRAKHKTVAQMISQLRCHEISSLPDKEPSCLAGQSTNGANPKRIVLIGQERCGKTSLRNPLRTVMTDEQLSLQNTNGGFDECTNPQHSDQHASPCPPGLDPLFVLKHSLFPVVNVRGRKYSSLPCTPLHTADTSRHCYGAVDNCLFASNELLSETQSLPERVRLDESDSIGKCTTTKDRHLPNITHGVKLLTTDSSPTVNSDCDYQIPVNSKRDKMTAFHLGSDEMLSPNLKHDEQHSGQSYASTCFRSSTKNLQVSSTDSSLVSEEFVSCTSETGDGASIKTCSSSSSLTEPVIAMPMLSKNNPPHSADMVTLNASSKPLLSGHASLSLPRESTISATDKKSQFVLSDRVDTSIGVAPNLSSEPSIFSGEESSSMLISSAVHRKSPKSPLASHTNIPNKDEEPYITRPLRFVHLETEFCGVTTTCIPNCESVAQSISENQNKISSISATDKHETDSSQEYKVFSSERSDFRISESNADLESFNFENSTASIKDVVCVILSNSQETPSSESSKLQSTSGRNDACFCSATDDMSSSKRIKTESLRDFSSSNVSVTLFSGSCEGTASSRTGSDSADTFSNEASSASDIELLEHSVNCFIKTSRKLFAESFYDMDYYLRERMKTVRERERKKEMKENEKRIEKRKQMELEDNSPILRPASLPVQESGDAKASCGHFKRGCDTLFPCCEKFYQCHRCHNNSNLCDVTKSKASDATHLRCRTCMTIQEFTPTSSSCIHCKRKLSEFFCGICKHYTADDKKPYHCEKCGICRVHRDNSFHCDVCNVCLNKKLKGKHKCRPDSGHDECCICLEDAFGGCQVLPCSHKVHRQCAVLMVKNGVRKCPICRAPIYQD